MSQRNQSTGSNERRRHTRRATRCSARVRIGNGEAINAEIQEYSDTGLYLAFSEQLLTEGAAASLAGSVVHLEFSSSPAGAAHDIKMDCQVVHASQTGIGVHASNMPDSALLALHSAGGKLAPAEERSHAAPTTHQTKAMRQACAERFGAFLESVASDVFEQSAAHLSRMAEDTVDVFERAAYSSAVETLAAGRIAARESIVKGSLRRIDLFGTELEQVARINRGSGLALMNDDDVDELLALTTVIASVESEIVPLLNEFELRYGRLVQTAVTRKNNPFGLEAICHAFRDVLRNLKISDVVRPVLHRFLQHTLSKRCPDIFSQLNRELTSFRTQAPHSVVRVQTGSLSVAPSAANGPQTDAETRLAEALTALYERVPSVAQESAPASGRLRVPEDHSLPEASIAELVAAIDRLPAASRTESGSALSSVVDEISARLVNERDGARMRLVPALRQILETTSNLVDRARADLVPSSAVESMIKRLERTLLKIAVRDPRFLTAEDHPARQVVNLIEQYSMAADDTGRFFDEKLHLNLGTLVDRVCTRADQDPEVFDVVRRGLEQDLVLIRQARRVRVEQLQEIFEGRERIRAARALALLTLEQRLSDQRVPRAVLRLLDAGLRHYLVLLAVREAPDGKEWKAVLGLLDRLLALVGRAPHDASSMDANNSTALLNDIERCLTTVVVDSRQMTELMTSLSALLAGRREAGSVYWDLVAVPELKSTTGTLRNEAETSLVQSLRVGEWWSITGDREPVPMQLIWLSPSRSDCAFTNRSATTKVELSTTELGKRIQGGRATRGDDLDVPMLDRSEYSMFDEAYQRLASQAVHDPLTGLFNRKGFLQRLGQLPSPASADSVHTVCVVEFDQFRMIANACGTDAVEQLARDLADKVRKHMGARATVASLRDDTIALLLQSVERDSVSGIVDKLVDALKDYPFQHQRQSYSVGMNVGVTEYVPLSTSATESLRRADAACVAAKQRGRNSVQVYELTSPELQSQELMSDLAGRFDSLLAGNGLYLRCQMVMPIGNETAMLPYYEILLGIEDNSASSPTATQDLIATMERLGRSHEVDIWVIEQTFQWINKNPESFAAIGGLSINLSAGSLDNADVMDFLKRTLSTGDIQAEKLIFEITETATIRSYAAAQDFIREIRRYGCRFSLDDFGSGFTSYAHLKNLHTDILKIDGSFITDLVDNANDAAMVKSMNEIGHALGMHTVAEWVESPAILSRLMELGVDYAQGYAVHVPCRLDEMPVEVSASRHNLH